MKKYIVIITLVILAFGASWYSINVIPHKYSDFKELKEFDFQYSFGVDAKNALDTAKGTFMKDLIPGSATAELKLSKEEMGKIYNAMKEVNILSYPTNYMTPSNIDQTPYSTNILKAKIDGTTKEINWEDKNASKTIRAVKLRKLFSLISNIIYEKEEYKKMPQANGGYL